MRLPLASLSLATLSMALSVAIAPGQTARRGLKRQAPRNTIKICQGVPIPEGYTVVAEATSPDCPKGAYLIKKNGAETTAVTGSSIRISRAGSSPPSRPPLVSRPRRVGRSTLSATGEPSERAQKKRPPTLIGITRGSSVPSMQAAGVAAPLETGPEEVGEDDVVRVDTTLVTVPVSVMDRNGKYIPNLRREDFRVFEDGVEQEIAYFGSTAKPFTVALLLDASGSTRIRLSDIQNAAIAFTNQLRPLDRVLVVTFNDEVLLLTEATNDRNVLRGVLIYNVRTGYGTRLYDAIDLVIRERLDKIPGRKAIVLFTDGVDTTSREATYESTMHQAEELDALVYSIQYDTYGDIRVQNSSGIRVGGGGGGSQWPFPGSSQSSGTVLNSPFPAGSNAGPGTSRAEYERADSYLQDLSGKTGARLYRAGDLQQLTRAFSMIAEELRRQYSLGYYPKTHATFEGERRQIKVQVSRRDLVVRARDSYINGPSQETK